MAAPQAEPTWQSISMLAMLTAHVEDGVTMVREQRATLERGLATPYVLDDAIVARVKRLFTQTAADNEIFAEQGWRWAAADMSAEQRCGVERYAALVEQMQAETTMILAIADELAKGTIETVLAKSDLELGIEALLRGGRL
ncbi:hypothetical protein [Streptosporangium roseum]|uniref:Uncharacterized protein n=1 Tax=Streptosporangium roseum (strain ATCC 12428 / DSM 43021 / JCM 3005 / KCTC 9067 / NCIMB 10171 / NRRL 2505 / NI 9100) TaxID=479432 RepID=D2B3R8_STRRD|nr:hypothetical protein [Streptosporangium roseum]ACZ89353.1 conserved hypothetical protein [Streptosporangium roseum DSM 43021]